MNLKEQVKACRRAAVPLVVIESVDHAASVAGLVPVLENGKGHPVVAWDCIRGCRGVNEGGRELADRLCGGNDAALATGNVGDFLRLLAGEGVPDGAAAILQGAQGPLADFGAQQAVLNLRDEFKARGCMLVLLVPVGFQLPGYVSGDCVLLSEPLPGADDLRAIVASLAGDAGVSVPEDTVGKAADCMAGLSAFAAEQAAALSLSKSGLDLSGLWDRKRKAIEQTPGLSVWRGGESFSDLGGLGAIKARLDRVLAGKRAPRVVVFIDEIEKAMGGATGGDLSGTKQDMLGALLSWWQDNDTAGFLFMGHPGSGKSAVAKAAGASAGVPTICFDFAGMQSSLVGESGARLRSALSVVSAVAGGESGKGRVLVLATCNSLAGLAPELRRRFSLGQYFFDLPTADERSTIWGLWAGKYGRAVDEARPADDGWTGAEIRACCDIADREGVSLCEAAGGVVPVCRSSAEVIEQRRREASGRLLNASLPGVYQYQPQAASAAAVGGRRVNVGD
jgi:hypothetical protein